MKIKTDFITNSSSTSFLCEICNHVEGGNDCSLSDADMYSCENDHTFCRDHIDKKDLINFIKEYLEEELEKAKTDLHPSANLIGQLESDLETIQSNDPYIKDILMEYELDSEMPEKMCPICNLNKINDSKVLEFVLKQNILNKEYILKDIKNRFKNLDELESYLKGEV